MKKCSIRNCNDIAKACGLCGMHYKRKQLGKDLLAPRVRKSRILPIKYCSVDGCNVRHYSLGYCQYHYQRFKKQGSATSLPLNQIPVRRKVNVQQPFDIDGDIPSEKKHFANVTVRGVRRTMAFYTPQEARAQIRAWKKEELEHKIERFQAMFESIKEDINSYL